MAWPLSSTARAWRRGVAIAVGVVAALLTIWPFGLGYRSPLFPVLIGLGALVMSFLIFSLASRFPRSARLCTTHVVLALMVGAIAWVAKQPGGEPDETHVQGSFPIEFADWHVGDVHTHAAGDFDLIDHAECHLSGKEFLPPAQCAQRLVSEVLASAVDNEIEWVILVEHGPWLGLDTFPRYDENEASDEWEMIKDAANAQAPKYGVRAMMGEELGTAIVAQTGHFSAYFVGDGYIRNSYGAVPDERYARDVAAEGGWGAVNHPNEGGSTWDCWYPGSRSGCKTGVVTYAQRALSPPEDVAFRALEITNGGAFPRDETLAQWDELLVLGYRIWPVGGSDAHSRSRTDSHPGVGVPTLEKVGISRTFAYVPGSIAPTDGFDSTTATDPVRQAIFSGHVVASNAPLAVANIDGTLPGDTAYVQGGENETVELHVIWPTPFSDNRDMASPTEVRIISSSIRVNCERPCIPDRVRVIEPPVNAGYVNVAVNIPSEWGQAYVRVEVVASDEGRQIGAFVAPIFIQRVR